MTALRGLPVAVLALACLSYGCGGTMPLLHGIAAVDKNVVEAGGGFSTRFVSSKTDADETSTLANKGALAPGMAPWVSGRLGFGRGFDAGLAYSGRALRVSGRKVFGDGGLRLSLGLGALGLLPKKDDALGLRLGGFGADIPVLVGWVSTSRRLMIWGGVRQSIEALQGQRELPVDPLVAADPGAESLTGWHGASGGVLGVKVGNDWIAAAFELNASAHYGKVDVGAQSVVLEGLALAPGGAVLFRF